MQSIALLVSIFGALVAFAVFMNTRRKDEGHRDSLFASINTKLDFIGDDLKDLKAQQRLSESRINEIREIAIDAKNTADTAIRRIDDINAMN